MSEHSVNDGGPIHPVEGNDMWGGSITKSTGMSLRDHAVIQFAAAMIAHPRPYKPREEDNHLHWHEAIVLEAGDLADAFIAARKGGAA